MYLETPVRLKRRIVCLGLISLLLLFFQRSGVALPVAPVLPWHGATGTEISPRLKIWVDGADGDYQVSFFYRKLPSAARSNFTVAALPDTQNYTSSWYGAIPEMFYAQAEWLVNNAAASNIVFVTHLGDCVQSLNFVESEWWVVTNAMYRLEDPIRTSLPYGVPYAIAPGNHDGPPYTFYNRYFGSSRFAGRPYYGGHYGKENNNNFAFFSAAGLDFISVQLEYAPGPEILAWANQVLATNQNRHAIIVSHSILNPGVSGAVFNLEGAEIYEALKANTNIFLMLCGHKPTTGKRTDTYNGSTITSLLSDYSYESHGTNGWMRLLEFVPNSNLVKVVTYSPYLKKYKTENAHHYIIPFNMSLEGRGYVAAGKISTNRSPSFLESQPLSGLAMETAYEWYVRIESASTNYTSPAWTFTTGQPPREFKVLAFSADSAGRSLFSWVSTGGRRYRVEYSDAAEGGAFTGVFVPITRPDSEEIDPAGADMPSVRSFLDDFQYTGGPPLHGARFFRVRELNQ